MDSNIVFWFSHKFYLSLDPPQLGWRTSLPYVLSFPKIFLMWGFNAWPKLAHSGTDFCYQLLACTHRQTSQNFTWLHSLNQDYTLRKPSYFHFVILHFALIPPKELFVTLYYIFSVRVSKMESIGENVQFWKIVVMQKLITGSGLDSQTSLCSFSVLLQTALHLVEEPP